MILAVQQAVHLFANLVVASTMALSLAIGVAGVMHQRFPMHCASCHDTASADYAAAHRHLVIAGLN